MLSLVRSRLRLPTAWTRPIALDASDQERRLHGLRRATSIALFVWPALAILDSMVASYVEPGRIWFYLALRCAGLALIALAALRLRSVNPPSARGLLALDAGLTTSLAALSTLACLEFDGLASPLVFGVILVLLGRAALVPDHARRNGWALGGGALVFVAVTALLALSDASMRAQWNEPRAIGAFGLHAGCVFAAAAVGIGGGHLVARYRHALREARTLARYDLVRLVGRGGMGEIWQARDRMLGRDVALKILRPDRDDERALARFAREVVKTASLRHPHTIRVFDYGKSDDGRAYYSMELLDGRDLAALVAEEGPLEASRAVEIARQAAEALGEAHSAGIVHRDVKPENIFLLRAGGDFVKVLDFGLAKVDDPGPALTSVGCIVGTPSCIAPEIVRAAPADPRTDVYALGCVLYFLLTGSTPFSGSTHDILTAHVRTPPEFPSVRLARRGSAERIDRAIERVVMRCLEKQPASRFQTAGELAQALTACAAERDAERTLADVCVTDALQVRNEDADTVPARCSTMPG